MESIKKVKDYYNRIVQWEWERMERQPIEFAVTKRYMQEYYPEGASVLDVGGGPGRYAIHLAKAGHDVTLVDLSSGNVAHAKEQAEKEGVSINAICANALELDQHIDGQYDVVQCMGPLYHLLEEDERATCIKQCLSCLKPGGLFAAAFISSYGYLSDLLINRPEAILSYKNLIKQSIGDWRYIKKDDEPGFTDAFFIHPLSIQPLMEKFQLEELVIAGIEGLPKLHEDRIKEQGQEVLDAWIDVAYELSQDQLTWAASQHLLYIGRKSDE